MAGVSGCVGCSGWSGFFSLLIARGPFSLRFSAETDIQNIRVIYVRIVSLSIYFFYPST